MKQVLCEVGGNIYGIDIEKVQGIEKKLDIVPVPNASKLVQGIANLRGEVIPIFSLYEKFKVQPKEETEETTYIIIKLDDIRLGFRVDAVAEIVELPESEFYPVPVIVHNEETKCLHSIIRVNDKLVINIEVGEILSSVEKANVSQMVQQYT